MLNLSQTANFRLFQNEELAEDNFECDENNKKFSEWMENRVHKFTWAYIGKNCQISLYLPIKPRLTKFCM